MTSKKLKNQNVGSTLTVLSHLKKATSMFGSGYPDLAIFPKNADILSDLVSTLGTMLHTSKFNSL